MNITDIDDKIIMRAREQNKDFTEVARFWEADFFDDMRSLNVDMPNVLTRVSEFIPEIIEFIGQIINNGFAYEANGSVYFDTEAFGNHPEHTYRKMEPPSEQEAESLEKLAEAEGALAAFDAIEKRNKADFALWKASKPDEPKWESPWGEGRPGWHIECSVMASKVLPAPMDIHTGGIDLKFPHHDNELAQSEAGLGIRQWVNYFLHGGHLMIKGRTMSKSKKNFIKIKELFSEFGLTVN